MTTLTDERSEPTADAGINTLRLDLALTRDELSHTLDQLFAKFNLRLLVKDEPGVVAVMALALAGVIGAVAAKVIRQRRHSAIPQSRYSAIPQSRYSAIPQSRYSAIPQSRYSGF